MCEPNFWNSGNKLLPSSGGPNSSNRPTSNWQVMPPPFRNVFLRPPVITGNIPRRPSPAGNCLEVMPFHNSRPPTNQHWQDRSHYPLSNSEPTGNWRETFSPQHTQKPMISDSQFQLNPLHTTIPPPIFGNGPPPSVFPLENSGMFSPWPPESSTISQVNVSEKNSQVKQEPQNIQEWLQNWVKKVENKPRSRVKKNKPKFGLRDVQNKLLSYATLIKELEKISLLQQDTTSTDNLNSISEGQDFSYVRANKIKIKLDLLQKFFEDSLNMSQIHDLIFARRNKRARKKLSDVRWRLKRKKMMIDREAKEKRIDRQLAEVQLTHLSKVLEKNVQDNADSVLGEVRKKKQEAEEVQAVIVSLSKLRKTRLKKGEAHGFVATKEQQELFDKMAENLSKVVDEQLSVYSLEERTLRVIMEESTMIPSSLPAKHVRKDSAMKQQLHKVLFGTDNQEKTNISSVASLVKIRSDWDQFVVEAPNNLSSSVPIGWVVPPTQPSQQWKHWQEK